MADSILPSAACSFGDLVFRRFLNSSVAAAHSIPRFEYSTEASRQIEVFHLGAELLVPFGLSGLAVEGVDLALHLDDDIVHPELVLLGRFEF